MRCPNFAIDSKTDKKTFDPAEVKRIYIEEGAALLRNKINLPPPFDEKQAQPSTPTPNPRQRADSTPVKPNQRPRWWNQMYNRGAKGISLDTWSGLMDPTDWKEVRRIIGSNGSRKSAGYDGVNCDLVELHSEDSLKCPTPFLEILTYLINTALRIGKSLRSWRKAIISMIPKRKVMAPLRPRSVK